MEPPSPLSPPPSSSSANRKRNRSPVHRVVSTVDYVPVAVIDPP